MLLQDLFITLCQIDSESGNEQKISEFIQYFLTERNINFTVQKDFQIIAKIQIPDRVENDDSPKTLLFCAHMDTVSPGKNIQPIIHSDGKITSSGNTILGADNKASLASILFVIDRIAKKEILPAHHLEFVFTVREEVDDPGIYEMNLEGLKADAGFIFDKANEKNFNTVVSVASSISDFTIEIIGKGAHAGTPELGTNAIQMMQVFLSELHLGRPYPNSTLNIGLINGGNSTNTVPEKITLSGDFRSESSECMKKIENDLYFARESVLMRPIFKDAQIDINIIIYCRGYSHNLESHNFARLSSIYQTLGHGELIPLKVQMGSDASCLMNHTTNAIETFCLNDGCFDVHSVNEWTTVENLGKIQKVIETISEEW